jgi:hypothetical protein
LHIAVGVFLSTFAGLAFADPATISLTAMANAAAGSAAGALISGLFSGGSKPQQSSAPAPVVAPVTPMPTQDTADAAKRKSIMAQMQRQGRASTILTAGNASTSDAMG